jgi:hypothetical protein
MANRRRQPLDSQASPEPAASAASRTSSSARSRETRKPLEKSAAELWAATDPPLHQLVGLLRAIEAHGKNLPDFILAFEPIIQAIRVALAKLGYLGADQPLTAKYAADALPNLLVSLGAAATTHQARRLSVTQVADRLQSASRHAVVPAAGEAAPTPRTRRPISRKKVLTKRERNRAQRLQFSLPRREKGTAWTAIYSAYAQKYPDDKKASPATLRLTCERNAWRITNHETSDN